MLDPDWQRVRMDIVDTVGVPIAPTFNAAFSLNGDNVPEPATTIGVVIGLGLVGYPGGAWLLTEGLLGYRFGSRRLGRRGRACSWRPSRDWGTGLDDNRFAAAGREGDKHGKYERRLATDCLYAKSAYA
jgi:hypothetical protein